MVKKSVSASTGVGALTLFHNFLICYRSISTVTNKNLVMLYLLRYQYISMSQLSLLVDDYASSSAYHNACVFIGRLCYKGLVEREKAQHGITTFSLTKEGLTYALNEYRSALHALIQSDYEFASTSVKVTASFHCTLDECINYMNILYQSKKPLKSILHQIAVNDSYLTLIKALKRTVSYPPQYELWYQYSAPVSLETQFIQQGCYKSTDVRSDALFSFYHSMEDALSLQHLILEQDTRSQSSTVLLDKLKRYRDKVLLPWLSTTKQLPPYLIFSLLTFSDSDRQDKVASNIKSSKTYYTLDALRLLSEQLALVNHCSMSTITVDYLIHYLASLPASLETSKKYLKMLLQLKDSYPDIASISELQKSYQSATPSSDTEVSYSRYQSRRKLLFSIATALSASLEELFYQGFSLSTISNDFPCILLSLLPDMQVTRFGEHLTHNISMLYNKDITVHQYEPVHRFSYLPPLTPEQAITLRNCYTMSDGTVYAVEQIGDDFGGYSRVIGMLKCNSIPCPLVLTFHIKDSTAILDELLSLANLKALEYPIYWCCFNTSNGDLTYNSLVRLSIT